MSSTSELPAEDDAADWSTQPPILLIDRLACGEGPVDRDEVELEVARALIAIADVQTDGQDPIEEILDLLGAYHQAASPQLFLASLLRLLAAPHTEWMFDLPWRPRLAGVFTSLISEKAARKLGMDAQDQAHEILQKLVAQVRTVEQNLESAAWGLGSLSGFKAVRQTILHALNDDAGEIVLKPFLPAVLEERIKDLYPLVDKLLSLGAGDELLTSRDQLLRELVPLQDACRELPTLYSSWILEGLCAKLHEMVDSYFSISPAAQVPELSITLKDRLYPLHTPGTELAVVFKVQNPGPGTAVLVDFELVSDDCLDVTQRRVVVERIPPQRTESVTIPCVVVKPTDSAQIMLFANWSGVLGESRSQEVEFCLRPQRADIDWPRLEGTNAYGLSAVTRADNLVGRRDILNRLLGNVSMPSMTTSVVWGQRRVGKTSIAKAFADLLDPSEYLHTYIESGEFATDDPRQTIDLLGQRICQDLKSLAPGANGLTEPEFGGALAPLTGFLNQLRHVLHGKKVVVVLDEFDELPLELYSLAPVGDAFFQTLRSLSSRGDFALVVVGGEKVAFIRDKQGQKINLWDFVRVDYFRDIGEFADLVTRPVKDLLTFEPEAIASIFDSSGGNPFFAILICRSIYEQCVQSRDAFVTDGDVRRAVTTTAAEAETNKFQHFWDDGVLEPGPIRAEKSSARKRVLIALSDALQTQRPADLPAIESQRIARNLESLRGELAELVGREIAVKQQGRDAFDFKVPFFEEWLRARGVHDLIISSEQLAEAEAIRVQEEETRLKPSEIQGLARQWGFHRDKAVEAGSVLAWLEQFGELPSQRAMFGLLGGIDYYSAPRIRQLAASAGEKARAGLHRVRGKGQRVYRDVCVVGLPCIDVEKTRKLLGDILNLSVECLHDVNSFSRYLKAHPEITKLVFVVDWFGTSMEAAEAALGQAAQLINGTNVEILVAAIVADSEPWESFVAVAEKSGAATYAAQIVPSEVSLVSRAARFFRGEDELKLAEDLMNHHGEILSPGQSGAGAGYVVLEHGCPLEAPAILWKDAGSAWRALFPRDDPPGEEVAPKSSLPNTLETSAMTIEEILQAGESDQVEFKSSARWSYAVKGVDPTIQHQIVKALGGLMNRFGGTLVVGVADDGAILGCRKDIDSLPKRNRDALECWLTDYVDNAMGSAKLGLIRVTWPVLNSKQLLRVDVKPSNEAVYVKAKTDMVLYVRLNNTTRALPLREAVSYCNERWGQQDA